MGKLGPLVIFILAILGAAWIFTRDAASGAAPTDPSGASQVPDPGAIPVLMLYGSEKQAWIEAVTTEFNARKVQVAGQPVQVIAKAMGSGELMDEVLAGRQQATLVSPASSAFIALANAKSRTATGKDLVPQAENVVLSPVVIAMWQPMAEALGWPGTKIGWADVLKIAQDPRGWATKGQAQWGRFRFGHTHPEYSNSGLQTLLAEVYAGSGKVAGLTLADVTKPDVGTFVQGIERSVVHYGSSTGFFAKRMFAAGPSTLSAAVLYENLVIEANAAERKPSFPVVAIYPKEGTFWSDHPTGLVDRPWVTAQQKEAAKAYVKFLLDRPQQERAMTFGFRPAAVEVALGAPIDQAHGVDPKEPATTLEVPAAEVIDGAISLWRQRKKPAHVVLAIDTSGSMEDDRKIVHAREGAKDFVDLLGEGDRLSILTFNSSVSWVTEGEKLDANRPRASQIAGSLIAGGSTSLYDAVDSAVKRLEQDKDAGQITAVVVLSDGADTTSKTKLADLLGRLDPGPEGGSGIRVFTIGYGKDAKGDVLKKIAEITQGKFYAGTTNDIRAVFRDIATFF